MDTKKTIKNLAIVLICLFGLALIGLNLYQHQQIKKATQGISTELSSDNQSPVADKTGAVSSRLKVADQNPSLAPGESQSAGNEGDDLSYQLEAAEEELEMINKQLSEEEAKKAEQRKIQKELQKRHREDPSFKTSMKRRMDTQYADLFNKLNLSAEEEDKFKDLLVEEMMAQQDIYYEYDTDSYATLSREQQEELNQRYMVLQNEYESKKEDLLGEENYVSYQTYSETQGERYNVNAFIETLDTGEKLTETTKEALIGAMHEAMSNVAYERIDDDSESLSNPYSEKNIARMLANYDRRIDAYIKAGNSILSAPQLEQFKSYLQKEREQYKLIMEMSVLSYGSSTTQKSAEKKSE